MSAAPLHHHTSSSDRYGSVFRSLRSPERVMFCIMVRIVPITKSNSQSFARTCCVMDFSSS